MATQRSSKALNHSKSTSCPYAIVIQQHHEDTHIQECPHCQTPGGDQLGSPLLWTVPQPEKRHQLLSVVGKPSALFPLLGPGPSMITDPRGGPAPPPPRINRRFPPTGDPSSPTAVSSQIRPTSFMSAILVTGTEMPHSSLGNVSPYDLTSRRRNTPRRSSLVG